MSFIKINKDEVYKMCTAKLEFIKKKRAEEDAAFEKGYLLQLNNGWFRRWFGIPQQEKLTEADKDRISNIFVSSLRYPSSAFSHTEEVCNRLLRAAYLCKPDMMYLDTEDLTYISVRGS